MCQFQHLEIMFGINIDQDAFQMLIRQSRSQTRINIPKIELGDKFPRNHLARPGGMSRRIQGHSEQRSFRRG
jgi:hypothetical protein